MACISGRFHYRSCYPLNHELVGIASADLCLQNRRFRDGPGRHQGVSILLDGNWNIPRIFRPSVRVGAHRAIDSGGMAPLRR